MRHAHTWAQRFWHRLDRDLRYADWKWGHRGGFNDLSTVITLHNIKDRCIAERSLKSYLEEVLHIGHSAKMLTQYRGKRL